MRSATRHAPALRAAATVTATASVRAICQLSARCSYSSLARSGASAASHNASLTMPARRHFSAGAKADTVVVLADHDNTKLLDSTLHVITAARALSPSNLVVLVLGNKADAVATAAAAVEGVNKVVVAQDAAFEHAMAESSSLTIADIVKELKATHVLTSTSASGKNVLPRLGAHLDVQPITDVIEIKSADTFVRPIYAGNAIATVQSADAIKVITVRPTSFDKAAAGSNKAAVESKGASASSGAAAGLSSWISEELTKSARPSLSSARIVVAGGRGLKSKENFKIIEELADAMGGAVGASRAAVDAGYVPNDYQIGQTGKVVAPELYIAVGISGAIQHLAGMKDSKVIVAINKDKEAPIFQVADYGLEGDLFKVVPDMTKAVKAAK